MKKQDTTRGFHKTKTTTTETKYNDNLVDVTYVQTTTRTVLTAGYPYPGDNGPIEDFFKITLMNETIQNDEFHDGKFYFKLVDYDDNVCGAGQFASEYDVIGNLDSIMKYMISCYDNKISQFSSYMPTVGVKNDKIIGWIEDYSIQDTFNQDSLSQPAPEPEDKSFDWG
jgi:hypothetical protein